VVKQKVCRQEDRLRIKHLDCDRSRNGVVLYCTIRFFVSACESWLCTRAICGTKFEVEVSEAIMRKSKPTNRNLKKHASVQRDAIEDIRNATPPAQAENGATVYSDPNRDRALGTADRTGRHFDAEPEHDETD
jgi:hypothetical protein